MGDDIHGFFWIVFYFFRFGLLISLQVDGIGIGDGGGAVSNAPTRPRPCDGRPTSRKLSI
jgi:hypothetical protein